MKLLACAILDKQVMAFMPVFFVRAKGEAIRHFMDACADKNAPFAKHPGDYELFVLADYDDVSGQFSQDASVPMRILSGVEASAETATS